ncbi:hypothetical protein [Hyphomicrobium sp. DMF-1]|uniref:hypothetical protein n=1 Tax=Hyphomicrobium sp. DMF-1 TaxID=3019544 RepID=UPI0022EBC13C|nr:hypothetical protein [Hyphomicrobium sp. DMF-1]WBT40183.1 hypothetical protein PE058_09955 [Hyphomicrobium sp. DMF-1]
MTNGFDAFHDTELIRVLEARGYVVRHKDEARIPLSWNRAAPFPEGLDFKAEAVERLREQITPGMIYFRTEPAVPPKFDGDLGRPEIRRAILRIL